MPPQKGGFRTLLTGKAGHKDDAAGGGSREAHGFTGATRGCALRDVSQELEIRDPDL